MMKSRRKKNYGTEEMWRDLEFVERETKVRYKGRSEKALMMYLQTFLPLANEICAGKIQSASGRVSQALSTTEYDDKERNT